jgi:hypothetical protein
MVHWLEKNDFSKTTVSFQNTFSDREYEMRLTDVCRTLSFPGLSITNELLKPQRKLTRLQKLQKTRLVLFMLLINRVFHPTKGEKLKKIITIKSVRIMPKNEDDEMTSQCSSIWEILAVSRSR